MNAYSLGDFRLPPVFRVRCRRQPSEGTEDVDHAYCEVGTTKHPANISTTHAMRRGHSQCLLFVCCKLVVSLRKTIAQMPSTGTDSAAVPGQRYE